MKKFVLILIILLAFLMRFYRVTEVPPALNWDEVSIGYNAYSIMKTGRDEWGAWLPLHFKSYGEYKLPVQIYASIPTIALFGLNELGVRMLPVLYGTATIFLLYLLAKALFNDESVALISALLLAVSPWHIQLTRGSFESSFALFWIVLGTWLFVKGLKVPKYLVLSMLPFALSIYTYNTARVFTVLFVGVLALLYHKQLLKIKKHALMAASFMVLLLIPLIPFVLSGEGSARYKLVSITDDPGLIPRIEQRRNLSQLPQPLPRLIHNRPVYISAYTLQHYFAHFTPGFLFISGAPHKQHHVQNIGQLYWVQAPFLLLGLYLLIKNKQPYRWLILSWLLLSFIPVAVTNDSIPHALRTLVAVPTYQMITAYGIVLALIWWGNSPLIKQLFGWSVGFVHERKYSSTAQLHLGILLIGLFLYQFIPYLTNYYSTYPTLYSRDWQYGNKQVVSYIKEHQAEYDQIIFSRHYGEPHMFTLFYLGYDPLKFQQSPNLDRFETHDWVRVLKFDHFYFPDLGDAGTTYQDIVAQNPNKKLLFIGKPGDFPSDKQTLYSINFLNGQPAFEVVAAP